MKATVLSSAISVALLAGGSQAAFKLKIAQTDQPTTLSKRYLLPRQDAHKVDLKNNFWSYAAEVSVGTPPQSISLAIDTGSSNTWFTDSQVERCTDPKIIASKGKCKSAFTPSKSSTFERTLPGAFNISYVNEDPITGDLISETFRIGDATITGQMLALANNGSNLDGVLGLGYTLIESTNQGPNPFTYPTVVDQLFDQGKINLKAYSLFLDSRDAKTGSIIFGGMDTDKYIGDLVQVPMAPRVSPQGDPVFDSLAIYLNHLKITNGTQTTNLTASALHEHVSLDSGSSLSYLPNDVAKTLFKALGAVDDTKLTHGPDASGGVFVNCSLKTSSLTIDYIFGDSETEAKIRVPISDIIYTSAEMLGEEYRYNTSSCVLGINPSISGMSLLGGTFLKSAYVVYDLSNNVMGLAQMNPDSTTEKIVDFKESDITIPGASKIASLVHPAETTTFYGGLENISSGTRIRMLSTTSTGTSTGTTAPTGVAAVPTQDSDAAPTASPSVTSSPAPRNSGERITATSGIIVGFAVSMATFLLSSGWLFI